MNLPRTKLTSKYCAPKRPPINWLKAAVLERQATLGYDLKRLSVVGGISYDYMRKLIRVSPWEWPEEVRFRICDELGIKTIQSVVGAPQEAGR